MLRDIFIARSLWPFRFEVMVIVLLSKCYLIQNSQAVKKECSPQKGYSEKAVKSKVVAKKWL